MYACMLVIRIDVIYKTNNGDLFLSQVFLVELRRIESELKTVNDELNDVNAKKKSAAWQLRKLRFLLVWQVLCRCVHYIFTMLTYLFFGFLHVTYVLLWLGANMVQTVLESQTSLIRYNPPRDSKPTDNKKSSDTPFWS